VLAGQVKENERLVAVVEGLEIAKQVQKAADQMRVSEA
jgi:hypothetical protein